MNDFMQENIYILKKFPNVKLERARRSVVYVLCIILCIRRSQETHPLTEVSSNFVSTMIICIVASVLFETHPQ